jgi:DNA-binding Xre family transcriptional regulator
MSTNETPIRRRLRVKEVLAEQSMSMEKLARRGWLAHQTVRTICHNPFHPAKDATLEKIAKLLHVPVSDLFEFVPVS